MCCRQTGSHWKRCYRWLRGWRNYGLRASSRRASRATGEQEEKRSVRSLWCRSAGAYEPHRHPEPSLCGPQPQPRRAAAVAVSQADRGTTMRRHLSKRAGEHQAIARHAASAARECLGQLSESLLDSLVAAPHPARYSFGTACGTFRSRCRQAGRGYPRRFSQIHLGHPGTSCEA